jgi:2-polyprenyl-6-methoxyphenol hydroxylase-like FAD-dependent oxidoreductase
MHILGEHALVIGGSVAGLMTARVLARHYARVTVIDRDVLPADSRHRKGVPHGLHAHGLLARGRELLESYFPGLTDDLAAQGALKGDLLADCVWFNHGVYLKQERSGLTGLLVSRPLLESYVRQRVAALRNVRLLEGCEALNPTFDPDTGRIMGVEVDRDRERYVLDADLVVDAAGRGSRAPDWLQALGYEVPSAEKVEVGIGYTTRLYRRKPEHAGGKLAVVVRGGAPDYRFGVALAQEDDSWIVSTGGYFGDAAPRDEEGLRAFVRSLPARELGEIVGSAEPISSFRAYRFAASVRRRYERLARFPAGYLLIGDALCSFNPSYGQGMTTAALEATALDECLAGGTEALARRFFRAAARIIDIPWQIAVGNDLAHPQVVGKRAPMGRFFGWYVGKLHRAAARDGLLGTRFLEVANLMATPTALLAPEIALRVMRGNLVRLFGSPELGSASAQLPQLDC